MTSIPEPSLRAGTEAFREGNYEEAIAHLEGVCAVELDPTVLNSAQQALIVAYCKTERPAEAIARCKQLAQTPDLYPWAAQTLADLTQRYRKANAANFVPPDEQTAQPAASPSPPSPPLQRPLPVAYQTPPEAAPSVYVSGRTWRNGERAKRWKKLKSPRQWKFWLRQAITLALLLWLVNTSLMWVMEGINEVLWRLPVLRPLGLFYRNPWPVVCGVFLVVFVAAPWFLEILLQRLYKLEPLPLHRLAAQYPETAKVFQRLTRHYQVPTPKLALLPTGAPVAMTYGHLPRTACIVLSDALLEQLEDDELAALLAAQFRPIVSREGFLMSGAIAFLQIPFTLYWLIAQQGERWREKPPRHYPLVAIPLLQALCSLGTTVCYTFYWLWRLPLLYVSRQRQYYSDRFAAQFTGNPNALSRALLKMTIGIARQIEQRQFTTALLESFDLLMPISHRQALTLGSVPDTSPFSDLLRWDCTNPYRHWLALVNSHPLLGDRLYLLNRYANHWKLQPEVDLPTLIPPPKTPKDHWFKLKNSYTALPILQSAILSGLGFGLLARLILAAIGLLSDLLSPWVRLPLWRLIWFYNAQPVLINACILAAFSLSLIVWINGYFPDIRISPSREDPRLEDLIRPSHSVPPKSYPVRLKGQLMGRQGLQNQLLQDLMLKTDSGSIKLHFFSKLGPLGNLLPLAPHPSQFIGQMVTVSGWFRRGSTPWIDVDIIRTQSGQQTQSGYPVWVTILAVLSAMGAAYFIWQA
ncbi:M48 family metalloprotease [Spirulina subsalsa FACHB-351]|uniref:M48 family metalloprotease n=1 Tax=Spirulina subsalsa FACHB-351 TaxID=234711 RepID=A0ABT3L1E3_9CYAN|nr:M48 family metalloprotease [Spirulina subsalsa]MCW6035324.1 M48 family metalloprotease [Spirulina subsalsa FACHB-351]